MRYKPCSDAQKYELKLIGKIKSQFFFGFRQKMCIRDSYEYSMSAPNDVLLIRKQELKSFFEENKVRDNICLLYTSNK